MVRGAAALMMERDVSHRSDVTDQENLDRGDV